MVGNLIIFLITIFFFNTHASELPQKEITLPQAFKKKWRTEKEEIKQNKENIDSYQQSTKKFNKEQKEIKARLKQKIASYELDITLLKQKIESLRKKPKPPEQEIDEKIALIQNHEHKINKAKEIVKYCEITIAQNKRNILIEQEKINKKITQNVHTTNTLLKTMHTIGMLRNVTVLILCSALFFYLQAEKTYTS